jgi:hypothetical protein
MDASSFTAGADYGIYAATMTGFGGRSIDTSIDIIASNPAIVREADGPEGVLANASNVAGTELATSGTYYLRARQFDAASLPATFCPYDFFVRVLSGSPIPGMDPNDEGVPSAPRSNGWRGRVIGEATLKRDSFAIAVNASDTIGVIVGVDLERGASEWKVMAGIGMFTGSFIITL